MASDLAMVPLLLGLGVDELSVSPAYLPQVKFLIRNLNISDAQDLANWARGCEWGAKILSKAQEFARKVAPNLMDGTGR
jgi:phosphoenolpyruvate-protein kinase (PTS system EI component)